MPLNMDNIEMITDPGRRTLQSTEQDMAGMAAIGKRQQFRRIFGFLPTLALSVTLLASWESVAEAFAAGLTNGGPVSLVYGMLLSITGTLALAASLSEMASICPIAGAQYHWTHLFAPPRAAAFITWMQGWITVFAWQATATSVVYLTAIQIQGLMILNYDFYVPERWHGTLLMWAVISIMFAFNVWGIRILPMIELLGGVCHIVFFIMILVALVVLAPQSSADSVFTKFVNGGGWASDGVSWSIGLLTVVYCFVGFDGAIHMSEEVKDSATTVPKVIILTICINGVLAFAFLIALLFCLGNIEDVLSTPTGFPIIAIFLQATGSKAAATAMEAGLIIIAFASGFALLASVSRLTFAFARDGGMPFSKFFAYVDPHYHIPIRSIALVSVVIVLLSLINIGSSIALNAILSLSTLALYVSYLIPITLLVMKRLRKEPIEFGPWRLGASGLWINLYAIAFGIYIVIFLPFPVATPVNAASMNYAGPVFLGLLLIALIDWFVRGRKHYVGPTQEDIGYEVEAKEPCVSVTAHPKGS
ncbi:hypothetical protein LTR36_002033 [Oleoguttula mirabilis]|uniref:Amino acid permease n=1 Tax=Oleoguttula mirabilis TaxID=1507867 RepID=A0AAV9JLZ8_9PEZI|nr:hypothetical protein LTR36_002033 [Oleoguttula mirabilis]